MSELPLETRRLAIRRRAFANLLLCLRDTARRTNGRLDVEGLDDAVMLLSRRPDAGRGGPGSRSRGATFTVLVVAPPSGRSTATRPGAHLDRAGGFPASEQRLAPVLPRHARDLARASRQLIYDNIRLRNRRLDLRVDLRGGRLRARHARRRRRRPAAAARRARGRPAMTRPTVPVVDVTAGVLTTVLPAFAPPVFLRLAPPAGGVVDRARQAYLRRATAHLRTCVADWHDGAGVLVAEPPSDALAGEVHELGRGLRALWSPRWPPATSISTPREGE
jgi:hypothetical protein